MLFHYPLKIAFSDLQPAQRDAITAAAAELGLETHEVDKTLRVTIPTPADAYRFGQKTGAFLRDGRPPEPLPRPSEEAGTAH